ncbi:MAG: hypothetical protein U9P14_03885 [Gemmatimonadota bacterium]|nr:hypothetical protein [Gemmatimonadota bacterium]
MRLIILQRFALAALGAALMFPSVLEATNTGTGAGPEDIYGGNAENRNYCTPYHLLAPGDQEDVVYEMKRPDDIRVTDKDHYQYWTKGNNITRSVTIDGVHVQITDWQQGALGAEYPRGSSFAIFRSSSPMTYSYGEYNARLPKDTVGTHFIGGSQCGGKIPEDLSYRQDLDYVGKMGNTWGLHVSTREADLADWPAEFCDESGEPIVRSDEDVVIVYSALGYGVWPVNGTTWRDGFKGGWSPYDCRALPWLEYQERIMSFGGSLTQDILFHEYKVINKSQYHIMPGVGPYDIEGLLIGPHVYDASLGDDNSSQRWAWVDSLRLMFTFEEDFTDPAMPDAFTPMVGWSIIRAPMMIDPETGDSVEAPVASVSQAGGFNGLGAWGSWTGGGHPAGKAYHICAGLPEWSFVQDPQRDPAHAGTMIPDISDAWNGQMAVLLGSPDFTLCPGESLQYAMALVCAFPNGSDPPSLATTPEGLSIVASTLFKNTMLAHTLYPEFKMAKAPLAPNVKLIPGDHQVTITWDNVSMYSRDEFFDVLAGQDNLVEYREYDFEGYRLYRSTSGQVADAVLLAQFDLKNGITLEDGILPKMTKVVIDGNEMEVPSQSFFDSLGVSEHDPDNGVSYGLGHDTGLRFSFVDRWEERGQYGKEPARAHRLTNGFRYFYAVTAYDWNGNSPMDKQSLESPLIFTEANMVIPRSNASSYSPAEITREVYEIEVLDGSGQLLDTQPRTNLVAGGVPLEESEVTNSFQNLYATIGDPLLLAPLMGGSSQAYFNIRVDSIVGEVDELNNPGVDPDYKADFFNKVFLSLLGPSGQILNTAVSAYRTEGDGISGTAANFILHPPPDSLGDGVPFNVEFNFPPYDSRNMLFAPVQVETGNTPAENFTVSTGYNPSGGSVPVGMRAADIELRWQETDGGDSLTLTAFDRTHGVEIPWRGLYSAGWTFYKSQSKLKKMSEKPRTEITAEELEKAGVRAKIAATPSRAGRTITATLSLCGFRVKFSVKTNEDGWQARMPHTGDVWVLRTNYGGLPADSLGYLDPAIRPPVEGVTYRFSIKADANNPENARLDEIKVVPNPYIASDVWDQSPLQKKISFTNLPSRAVIRIYTVSGNLIQVLRHEGSANAYRNNWKGGQEFWNLRNRYNMLVASGWYIWHVTDLDTGKTSRGKFAIIQ